MNVECHASQGRSHDTTDQQDQWDRQEAVTTHSPRIVVDNRRARAQEYRKDERRDQHELEESMASILRISQTGRRPHQLLAAEQPPELHANKNRKQCDETSENDRHVEAA